MLIPVGHTLHTTTLDSWTRAPGLSEAWDGLVARAPAASVFQTPAWLCCWWRSFGARADLRLLLTWDGARLVGAAPVSIETRRPRRGPPRRIATLIGSANHAADYCDFIVDPEYPQALDALLARLAELDCDRIDLSHVPGHSPHRERLVDGLRSHGLLVTDDVQNEAPVRHLGNAAKDRKVANKTSLKRNKRYFEKLGTLSFRRVHDVAEINALLPAFFEQHRHRWAETDFPSLFLDPVQRSFYRDLVGQLAPRGYLAFDVLMLDDRPLAFHLGFEFHGRFIWYKPTFDVSHAPKSPGQVLLKFLLEHAIRQGFDEFDFTIGGEGFKHRFANETRHIHRIVACRSATDFWRYRTRTELKKRFGNGLA